MRASTFTVRCPLCGDPLTVTVTPGCPGTHTDPPEGPQIESISGCPCVDGQWSDQYEDEIMRQVGDADEAAYERAMDARVRALLDGDML